MATRETRRERGRRLGDEALRRLVNELRTARQVAGLSQHDVAGDAGWAQSELHRFEANGFENVSLLRVGALASVLGLELSVGLHPTGDGLRDQGQQAVIARFVKQIDPAFRVAREVPFPNVHDLRSWDMVLRLDDFLVGVEVETRLHDVQELVRRIRQRERDGGVSEIVVVLADTAHNRAAADQFREALGDEFATLPRVLWKALRSGQRLPGSGVILV